MSSHELPAGWIRVRFGDVVRKVNDRVDPATAGINRYVAGEHMDTDDLKIRRWGDVGDGYLGPAFHMRFEPGQVLYGSRRTYLRKVAVAGFEGICANTTFVLEPSSKDLLPEFLPLVMTTEAFHDHSIKQSKGSVNPYINFSDITWYEFALPPLDEQRRLVEVMVAFDNTLEAYTNLPVGSLRNSMLFGMDRDAKGRKLGGRHPGWSRLLLGEVAKLDCARVPVKSDDEYPIAGVANAGQGIIERPAIRGTQTNYPQLHRLRAGQLVMRKLTAWEGPIAIVPDSFDGWFVSPEFPTFTLEEARILPDYMSLLCQRPEMWSSMAGVSAGTVERRKRASPSQLLSIEVHLPPLEVQGQLVEAVRRIDRLGEAVHASKQSLLAARRTTLDTQLGRESTNVH